MDFTEIYKQTGHLVKFSPGTSFILSAVGDRLVVRQASNFQITRSWLVDTAPSASTTLLSSQSGTRVSATDGTISHIGWSKDSEYILAACAKRGIVNVYAMRDDQWNARIEAGAEGLVRAEWAPDGRNILCFSEWGVSAQCRHCQSPIHLIDSLAPGDDMVTGHRYCHIHPVS